MMALVFSVVLLTTVMHVFAFPAVTVEEHSFTHESGKDEESSEFKFETTNMPETTIDQLPFRELNGHSKEELDSSDLQDDSESEIALTPDVKAAEEGTYDIVPTEDKVEERSLPLELLDDIDEEEAKLLELEESSNDQPPEGFPLAFFQDKFISLRRLGEPKITENGNNGKNFYLNEKALENSKSEPETELNNPKEELEVKLHQLDESREDEVPEGFPENFFQQYSAGFRRLKDPAEMENKNVDLSERSKQGNNLKTSEGLLSYDGIVPIGQWKQFTSFVQPPWETLTSGQSGYGYHFQQPNAHGFVHYY